MERRICMALLLACSTIGCTTTLTHQAANPGKQPSEPGFEYYLPKQRYTISATYQLASCPQPGKDKVKASAPLIVTQSASVVEASIADTSQVYSIPMKTLTSGTKTTTVSAGLYDNLTIHTFGANVEDRSAEVVKGAVGTALSVARLVVGIPTARTEKPLCRPEIYAALDAVNQAKTKILDPSIDDKTRATWATVATSARSTLLITKSITFDPSRASPELDVVLDQKELLTWFQNARLISAANEADRQRLLATETTHIQVRKVPDAPEPLSSNLGNSGLFYRVPAQVTIDVCAGSCADKSDLLVSLDSFAAQFGREAVVTLDNGAFDKNNLSLTFSANGALQSYTFGTESSLEKLASSASDTASSVEGYLDKKRASDKAAADAASGAELKSIQAATAVINAKADRLQAEARLKSLGGD